MKVEITKSHITNHVGKFYVSYAMMNMSDHFAELLAQLKFIPIRTEFLYHPNHFGYEGYSELFEANPEGCVIPEYIVSFEYADDFSIKQVITERRNIPPIDDKIDLESTIIPTHSTIMIKEFYDKMKHFVTETLEKNEEK